MRTIKSTFIILMLFATCQAQDRDCGTVTIGDVFHVLKSIDTKQQDSLHYEKYKGFNYKEFKPIDGGINENDFFEIGYNSQKTIKEIVRHQNTSRPVSHKMIVYEFKNYRIMLYQIQFADKAFGYTPAAFVMMQAPVKDMPKNFMINVLPQFGDGTNIYKLGLTYDNYPIRKFEDISAIMVLDEDLYPTDLCKISNGQIVFDSHIYYTSNRVVDYESASIFFGTKYRPKLKITESMCLDQIIFHHESPDMVLPLRPSVGAEVKSDPLWIFAGAHDYKP